MIRVLLVDDHRLVRASLRRVLEDAGDIVVVGEAGSGEAAVSAVRNSPPDVVIMDVSMPGIGGLEATRKLREMASAVRVVVVSAFAENPYPRRLLDAGASGFLSKDCEPEELVEAVRAAARDETYLSGSVAQKLARAALNKGKGGEMPLEQLSQREMQVLVMVVRGHSTREISDALFLSPKTVSTYRSRLYGKLGVGNDVELTHYALRHGISIES